MAKNPRKMKEHRRVEICIPSGRKVRYPRRRLAQQAAGRSPLTLREYKCEHCRDWHLTSRVKPEEA